MLNVVALMGRLVADPQLRQTTTGKNNVIIVTKHGKCICFSEDDVRPMNR